MTGGAEVDAPAERSSTQLPKACASDRLTLKMFATVGRNLRKLLKVSSVALPASTPASSSTARMIRRVVVWPIGRGIHLRTGVPASRALDGMTNCGWPIFSAKSIKNTKESWTPGKKGAAQSNGGLTPFRLHFDCAHRP